MFTRHQQATVHICSGVVGQVRETRYVLPTDGSEHEYQEVDTVSQRIRPLLEVCVCVCVLTIGHP